MVKLRRINESELYLESKKDLDDLKAYLGDALFDDYMKIRDKISDPNFKDFSKLKKMDKKDVQDFVSSFQSKSDKKKSDKTKGAKKLYEDSDWVVYKITSYPAAQLYGSGTKWCITGRYPGHEERGQEYFDDYIRQEKLDGGYYFYLSKEDPNEKYCVLQTKNGKIKSIWNAKDTNLGSTSKRAYDDARVSLPEVKEVNLQPVSDSYKNDFSLFEAISRDDLITIKSLLQKNVNLNKNAKTKNPIIFHAIDKGNPNIIGLLLENGASPNKKNNVGDTPLLRAAQGNDLKAIELLLKHKAKPFTINSNGGDLMYYACQQGMYKLVELLLKYKVDPNKPVTASKTKTPLQIANDYNYPDIVKLLKKYGAKE